MIKYTRYRDDGEKYPTPGIQREAGCCEASEGAAGRPSRAALRKWSAGFLPLQRQECGRCPNSGGTTGFLPALSLDGLRFFIFSGVKTMSEQLNRRDPGLDIIRAAAILMVVAIHVTSSAISNGIGSGSWWTALIWGSLIRPAVPLFFMCSGALLLSRDIPLKRLYGRNVLRIVILMLFWSLVAGGYRLVFGGLSLPALWETVKNVLLFRHETHFYFLHILLLVYIFLPVTRSFVKQAGKKELGYFLIVWFVTGILFPLIRRWPPFSLIAPLRDWYTMNIAWSSIGYTVLGYWLRQYGREIPRKWYVLSLVGGAAIIFAGTAVGSLSTGVLAEHWLDGWAPGAMFYAAGLFGLILTRHQWKPAFVRFTGRLSKASLCIYLIHGVFMEVLAKLGLSAHTFLPLFSIPVTVAVIVALNWLVYEVLSRIPIVKDWLV